MTRALIEQWLPAATIGAESMRERGASSALPPINFLHVWWARRPLTASRAAVLASLLPAWPSVAEADADPHAAKALAGLRAEFPAGENAYHAWYLKALGILGDPVAGRAAIKAAVAAGTTTRGNAYGYDRAFTYSPDEDTIARICRLAALRTDVADRLTVLDPFAGGGSIPFEAARYGCDTIANELNPVATAILEGTVVQPATLGPAFAEVLKVWGEKWTERVRKRLEPFFPIQHPDERPAFIWAHTVPCPTTGRPTPLAPDFWLARGKAGRDVAVALEVDRAAGTYSLRVVEGRDAKKWGDRSTYKKGAAESIWTGETFSGDYIRRMGQEGHVGAMLLAVSITRSGAKGRHFRAPTDADLAAVAGAEAELARRLPAWEIDDLVPNEPIFEGKETKRSVDMGLTRWSAMFTHRQLLTNLTALAELRLLEVEARAKLPLEQARAVALYLALALDKACDYNGMLSSWHSSRMTVRNTFDRHDFAYKWSFAEFDGAHSLMPWAVNQVVDAYRGIATLAYQPEKLDAPERSDQARIVRGSAATLPLPDGSVDAIVTDPPYYDNVMYAECSDYFYVWLKRSLRETWPQYADLVLTDKDDEAVANPALFKDVATAVKGRKRGSGKTAADLADARYEQLLNKAFREAHRVLKADGILTVMFTHKRVDAWDTLGAALLDAGFSIDASWPVHTESEHSLHQAKKNAAASTIFLACRKRETSEPAYWADIRRDVEHAAEEAAHRFADQGMTGVDLTIATYGPVLSVLSDRWPVYTGELDAAGAPEVLRPDAALDLARERVAGLKKRGLLGGRDVEFDRVTDWWLLAWNDFAAAEFPYDEARKLSIATHLELDDLAKTHRVVKQGSGTVTVLTPAQRRTAGRLDPDATSFDTWLDRLHALMLVYDEDGLAAARAWLARTGLADDQRLSDVLQAALNAVPRVKSKGVFARPEARILDSMRTALFEHVPAPVDPSPMPAPVQAAAFEIEGELGFKLPGELGYEDDDDQDEDEGDDEDA
jgi:adenine-specific DNA methylase